MKENDDEEQEEEEDMSAKREIKIFVMLLI